MIKEEKVTFLCNECKAKEVVTTGDEPEGWYRVDLTGNLHLDEALDICSFACLQKAINHLIFQTQNSPFHASIEILKNPCPKVIPVNNVLTKGEIIKELQRINVTAGLNPKMYMAADMAIKIIDQVAKAAGIGDNDPFEL